MDEDLALAQALQEQERAQVWSRFQSSFDSFEYFDGRGSSSSYMFTDLQDLKSSLQMRRDEMLARALQDAEDQEQFMIMLQECNAADEIPVMRVQERQDNVDPDGMTYEQLRALGDALGTQNIGLTANEIDMLESRKFKKCGLKKNKDEQCAICQHAFERQGYVIVLPCRHVYHTDCIRQWLQIRKVCPVCNVEVVVSKCK